MQISQNKNDYSIPKLTNNQLKFDVVVAERSSSAHIMSTNIPKDYIMSFSRFDQNRFNYKFFRIKRRF